MKWGDMIPEGLRRRDVPGGLWMRCDSCEKMIYRKVVESSNKVCPECGGKVGLVHRQRKHPAEQDDVGWR